MTIYVNHEIDIAAPAETVWAIVADYGRDPEWRTGVISMVPTPPGPLEVGTRTVEHMRLAGKAWRNDGEVIEVDPGRTFRWRTTEGADASGRRAVEPDGPQRCSVRMELQVEPHGAEKVMAPVLGRMLDRNLRGDLRRLRDLAEGQLTGTAARPSGTNRRSLPVPQ